MIFFGVLIALGIMGGMIYLAVDKKSDFRTRLAALGALAIMILTVIICLVIALTDTTVPFDPSTVIVGEPHPVAENDDSGLVALLFSIVFLIILFVLITVLALREHKRPKTAKI